MIDQWKQELNKELFGKLRRLLFLNFNKSTGWQIIRWQLIMTGNSKMTILLHFGAILPVYQHYWTPCM